ncbi:Acetyltransferase, GNAT family [Pseudomonas savastanoi pv. glycinea]|uniref:Acetyltransferase n=1 Tax=Pseudomonas savastanoi pv. glycinea TaxID=318 RepID=A0A3M3LIJ4_PSESG|nr:Acetyltransferase, GNAT family [Pseudomonas savastanoi pv. glycinea]RMO50059.1 Acetyltransferase [Pseudomonas savastanoi pv. glycinea]RMP95049.1 Acetyltransferase, GNAT family [Pseudomonas savastanoi pv. glycinea]
MSIQLNGKPGMRLDMPSIRTSRLLLCPLRAEQSSALSRLADDPVIANMTATVPSPYTLEHAQAFIADAPEQFAAGRTLSLGVHAQETGELTGVVSLRLSTSHRSGNLGYWIGADYRNQGYTSEAVQGLLMHGFTVMNLNRIAGQCFADNMASARVLEKCGLSYEGCMKEAFLKNGVFKDMLLFGLLRSQYEPAEAAQ